MIRQTIVAACFAAILTAFPPQAQAWVRVGINLGFPVYPGPYYGPYGYPYYQPYPYYVGPAPVYVVPSATVVQPAPSYQPVPAVRPPETRTQSYAEPLQQPRLLEGQQADVSRYMQQLANQDERVRSDAALELGRMKAQPAIDSLSTMLNSDPSPVVRETAARALGLIGSVRGLTALQTAAQSDNDRDVRRSAQFAAEVIRANLRKD